MREPLRLSPLGFGCAPIMGKVGKSQAMRAMGQAFDLGVTHFDVARSYGFGRAERVVGEFIKGRRDQVTVTSKFGVVPPMLSWRTRTLIPVARAVATAFPQLRTRLKRKSGQLLAERRFDVAFAQQCLHRSLSELNTDYIDIYLIHEPEEGLLNNSDAIIQFLEDCVSQGKIRRWGFAYGSVKDYDWANVLGGDVLQCEGNIGSLSSSGSIQSDARQRIVTRPFMGGLDGNITLDNLIQDFGMYSTLRELDVSLADVSLILAHRIAGQSGSVLCSMFSPEHIRNNVRTINALSDDERMADIVDKIFQAHSSWSAEFFR